MKLSLTFLLLGCLLGNVRSGILSSVMPFQMLGSSTMPALAAFLALSSLKLQRDHDGGLSLKIRPGFSSGGLSASGSSPPISVAPWPGFGGSGGYGGASSGFGFGSGSAFGGGIYGSSYGSEDPLLASGSGSFHGFGSPFSSSFQDMQTGASQLTSSTSPYGSRFKAIHILHKPGGGTVMLDGPPSFGSAGSYDSGSSLYGLSPLSGSYSPSPYRSLRKPSSFKSSASSLASAYGPPYLTHQLSKSKKKGKKSKGVPYYVSDYVKDKDYQDTKYSYSAAASEDSERYYEDDDQLEQDSMNDSQEQDYDGPSVPSKKYRKRPVTLSSQSYAYEGGVSSASDHHSTGTSDYTGSLSQLTTGNQPLATGPVPVTVSMPPKHSSDGPTLTIRINKNKK